MNESLKKGIRLIAFGFLFTLLNINLTLNGSSISITPDFIGWILLTMAFDHLEEYARDRKYLKYISMVMIVLSGAQWILSLIRPELDASILKAVCSLISAVYMFLLMGILVNIAEDCGSVHTDTLRFLRYANPFVTAAIALVAFLFRTPADINPVNIIPTLAVAVIGIVVAIMTALTLFRLNSEIENL